MSTSTVGLVGACAALIGWMTNSVWMIGRNGDPDSFEIWQLRSDDTYLYVHSHPDQRVVGV